MLGPKNFELKPLNPKYLNYNPLKLNKMKKTTKRYEAPQAEIIEIEPQGMLCASGGAVVTNMGGGTESMTMVEIGWP